MAKAAPPPASESTLSKLTEQLNEQNKQLDTLVGQGQSQIDAAEDAAAAQREAAREAARAADSDGPEIAVKVEMEDESGGMWKKLKLGSLVTSLMGFVSTGISTAMNWLGTQFGPKLLTQFAKFSPWALIIAGLSLAIKDGITGMFNAEDMGVSKTAGFIGGFLGGGAKGGIANAFANAGKWALVGAGIGALMGVGIFSIPGAIIGGLLGAVLGGILGWIGGEKIAKGADEVGGWFKKQFDDLIIAPIKAIWDAIAPDWIKNIDFEWDDLMPPALTKLFGGKYFTVDFPEFSWMDLFPKFLVDLFNNLKVAGKDVSFGWMDLLPKFLVKFFAGEYEKEGSFQWSDLLPEFINKIIGIATTGWENTDFTWKSLVPNFIIKLIEGTEIKPTGEFSWKDLVPGFIWKLVDGAVAAAKTDEGFVWSNLLPDWMIGAWKSTMGLAGQVGAFDWRALLPDFIADFFGIGDGPLTIAGGAAAVGDFDWRSILPDFISDLFPGDGPLKINDAIAAVGAWNWKSLLPKFIQDFFDDPTKLAKEIGDKGFDWKDLLPEFIRDFFGDKKIDQAAETVGLAMDWWKSLLPDWIVNVMEGKSPFADRDESADEKTVQKAKDKLNESVAGLDMPDFSDMFDMSMMFAPIRDKINELAADASFPMSSVYPHLLKLFPEKEIPLTKSAAGGIVGMSPFAAGSMGKSIGLESGGLFTLSQGEFVLDNQAAQTFLQAAMILKGQDMSGLNLANLQRDSVATAGQASSAPIVISNSPTTQINQNSTAMIPLAPIQPGNKESMLS